MVLVQLPTSWLVVRTTCSCRVDLKELLMIPSSSSALVLQVAWLPKAPLLSSASVAPDPQQSKANRPSGAVFFWQKIISDQSKTALLGRFFLAEDNLRSSILGYFQQHYNLQETCTKTNRPSGAFFVLMKLSITQKPVR